MSGEERNDISRFTALQEHLVTVEKMKIIIRNKVKENTRDREKGREGVEET